MHWQAAALARLEVLALPANAMLLVSLRTYGLWISFELASEVREALLAVVVGVPAADVLFNGLDGAGDVVFLFCE